MSFKGHGWYVSGLAAFFLYFDKGKIYLLGYIWVVHNLPFQNGIIINIWRISIQMVDGYRTCFFLEFAIFTSK